MVGTTVVTSQREDCRYCSGMIGGTVSSIEQNATKVTGHVNLKATLYVREKKKRLKSHCSLTV